MRSKGNKKSKLMKIILAPIKVLSKARDFYVKGMDDWASRLGNGGVMGGPGVHVSQLPKSFSFKSSRSSDSEEELAELLRSASKRAMECKERQEKNVRERAGMQGMRSYSVGIGKIGRIDEDKPCSFEEDVVYPRSRSCAVGRNVVVYR
ncbi:hypothetical protein SLEP1_g35802 [Rubroshorea leprosula]|uniref:Uncharacterized protein n=1 Tax=Rubroshorea leprosula TaxID=152421 RepID=A0AAV5KPI9_9ROSI|nr:hypothetical protein SLEP1_g35802 [Rubroshorea leprosula]